MTAPVDPTAAIARLRATLPVIRTGHLSSGLARGYSEIVFKDFLAACAAFATDIELLASLTQVGWGIGCTDSKGRFIELQELRVDGSPPGKLDHWFPVYARVLS